MRGAATGCKRRRELQEGSGTQAEVAEADGDADAADAEAQVILLRALSGSAGGCFSCVRTDSGAWRTCALAKPETPCRRSCWRVRRCGARRWTPA